MRTTGGIFALIIVVLVAVAIAYALYRLVRWLIRLLKYDGVPRDPHPDVLPRTRKR
jgi:hypothetical protein